MFYSHYTTHTHSTHTHHTHTPHTTLYILLTTLHHTTHTAHYTTPYTTHHITHYTTHHTTPHYTPHTYRRLTVQESGVFRPAGDLRNAPRPWWRWLNQRRYRHRCGHYLDLQRAQLTFVIGAHRVYVPFLLLSLCGGV